jgi:hypothetical protein
MSFKLVYKDPYNGRIKFHETGLVDVPPTKVRSTIAEFKKLFAFMLPPEKENVHYALIEEVYVNNNDGDRVAGAG